LVVPVVLDGVLTGIRSIYRGYWASVLISQACLAARQSDSDSPGFRQL
jgi:hypothetical protein